jgi:hypothetical protein
MSEDQLMAAYVETANLYNACVQRGPANVELQQAAAAHFLAAQLYEGCMRRCRERTAQMRELMEELEDLRRGRCNK